MIWSPVSSKRFHLWVPSGNLGSYLNNLEDPCHFCWSLPSPFLAEAGSPRGPLQVSPSWTHQFNIAAIRGYDSLHICIWLVVSITLSPCEINAQAEFFSVLLWMMIWIDFHILGIGGLRTHQVFSRQVCAAHGVALDPFLGLFLQCPARFVEHLAWLKGFSHSDDLPGAFCLGILDDLAAKPKGFDWPQQHHHSLRASFQSLLRGWCHCGRTFVVPLQRGGRSGSSRRVVSQIEPLQGWFWGVGCYTAGDLHVAWGAAHLPMVLAGVAVWRRCQKLSTIHQEPTSVWEPWWLVDVGWCWFIVLPPPAWENYVTIELPLFVPLAFQMLCL